LVIDFPEEWSIPFEEIEIKKQIGRGSFGVVWQAMWRGSEVAVKQMLKQDLDQTEIDEFVREGKLMMHLPKHENIVNLFGVCINPVCIITKFFSEGSLDKLLEFSSIDLDQQQMLSFCKDTTNGLGHLHNCGLIHRDLAARNILLSHDWRCSIADFGMSRANTNYQNQTNSKMGPIKWMAPEAILSSVYSVKTDIYSLGVTFCEILNREEPFPETNIVNIALEVIEKGSRPKVPTFIPTSFSDLIWNIFDSKAANRPTIEVIIATLNNLDSVMLATPQNKNLF